MKTALLVAMGVLLPSGLAVAAGGGTLRVCRAHGIVDTFTGKAIRLDAGTTLIRANGDRVQYEVELKAAAAIPAAGSCTTVEAAMTSGAASPHPGDKLLLSGAFRGPSPNVDVTVESLHGRASRGGQR